MNLNKNTSEIFIPNNESTKKAISQTTHLCIGAHQDDVEIMAYHGIEQCFQNPDKHFTAVVVTDGSGSARDNIYKNYTNEEMIAVRKVEQKKAAILGEYSSLILLDHPSSEVKDKNNKEVIEELKEIILETSPDVLYTHNLADKHDTHIGVVIKTIKALRSIPQEQRPKKLIGCEVWRALDWVNDDEKLFLNVSGHKNLSAALVEVFDSQIIGGKRYDSATVGRRLANATFANSHMVDAADAITYAMDLTPLIKDDTLSIVEYITNYINRFKDDVTSKINKVL